MNPKPIRRGGCCSPKDPTEILGYYCSRCGTCYYGNGAGVYDVIPWYHASHCCNPAPPPAPNAAVSRKEN